jgi:DNA-binding CsgD family transcriptional regulator
LGKNIPPPLKFSICLLITCLAACVNYHACAQVPVDSLVNQPYKKRIELVSFFYSDQFIYYGDSLRAARYADSVKAVAEKAGDEGLMTEALFMRGSFCYTKMRNTPKLAEASFQDIKKQLDDYPNDYDLARYNYLLGNWNCYVTQNYELAFVYLQRALDIYRRLPEPILDYRPLLQGLADQHYKFGDYAEAIGNIKEALAITNFPPSRGILIQGNNDIGLCYQHLKNLDSSDYYFRRTYAVADSVNDYDWKAIASGNLGNNLFLRGKYAEAIPLLRFDVDVSIKRNDWPCASGSQTILADIMLRQNNLTAAAKELDSARQYVYRSTQYQRFKPLYPLLSKYYAAIGNAKLATEYLDSSIFVNDSLDRKFDALKLLKAEQKTDVEKRDAAVTEIENQKHLKIIERNVVAGFVLILFVASLYVYRNQRKRYLQRQQLLSMQLQQKEIELNLAAAQLENFAKNISEKNSLLETLQHQFGENSNNTALLQLQQSTILTDEEWENFRAMFEKVHGGYLNRLKQKLPGLSPSEIRYMVLAKLHLSNKEMAATLGVSKEAIRVTTHRLRKKLHLSEDGSLEEVVDSI